MELNYAYRPYAGTGSRISPKTLEVFDFIIEHLDDGIQDRNTYGRRIRALRARLEGIRAAVDYLSAVQTDEPHTIAVTQETVERMSALIFDLIACDVPCPKNLREPLRKIRKGKAQ